MISIICPSANTIQIRSILLDSTLVTADFRMRRGLRQQDQQIRHRLFGFPQIVERHGAEQRDLFGLWELV
ncbi:hypothetical protein D3C75_1166090 [compost metagenome]